MELCVCSLKTFLILCFARLSLTYTHTLQYIYTEIRRGIAVPEFIAVGLVDGEQFVYYDSNIRKMILKTEWIQKINSSDSDYWSRETEHMKDQQDRLKNMLSYTKGCNILQLMYGCQLKVSTNESYMKFGYNGEDFFHLDLNTETWTTDKHEAEIFIKDWDRKGDQAEYRKDQLETHCIDQFDKFVSYGRETLERKVRPEVSLFQNHSSSPEVVCHATGFFPKALNITWQKDREDVSKDVELSETLPNHNGSFQRRSVLKVSAEELQKHKYTCVIQHSSLEEDLVLPVSERRILTGGGSGGAPIGITVGVVVGLIAFVVVAGIIFWIKRRRNKSDFTSIPVVI